MCIHLIKQLKDGATADRMNKGVGGAGEGGMKEEVCKILPFPSLQEGFPMAALLCRTNEDGSRITAFL